MKWGDLYWFDLPDRGGREQRGRRPTLIWQDLVSFGGLPTVLTIPLTSQLDTLRFPGTILVQPSPDNGLRTQSVVLVFQLGATDVRRVRDRLGRLSDSDLAKIRDMAAKLQSLT